MKQNTKTIFMAALQMEYALTLDHIRHHVNVANGFMTVPPADNPDLDNYMDDIDDENDAKYLEEIKK